MLRLVATGEEWIPSGEFRGEPKDLGEHEGLAFCIGPDCPNADLWPEHPWAPQGDAPPDSRPPGLCVDDNHGTTVVSWTPPEDLYTKLRDDIVQSILDCERDLWEPRGPIVVDAREFLKTLRLVQKTIPPKRLRHGPNYAAMDSLKLSTHGTTLRVSSLQGDGRYVTHELGCEGRPLESCVDPEVAMSWLSDLDGDLVLYRSMRRVYHQYVQHCRGAQEYVTVTEVAPPDPLGLVGREGKSRTHLSAHDVRKFPEEVEPDELPMTVTIGAQEFVEAVKRVQVCAAKNHFDPGHDAVLISRTPRGVFAWATNSYQYARQDLVNVAYAHEGEWVTAIPLEVAKAALRAMGNKPKGHMRIDFNDNLKSHGYRLTHESVALSGTHESCWELRAPKLDGCTTSDEEPERIPIDAQVMDIMAQAAKILDGYGGIDLLADGQTLRAHAQSAKLGAFDTSYGYGGSGAPLREPVRTRLNATFMMGQMKLVKAFMKAGEAPVLTISGPSQPAYIEAGRYGYYLMPMSLPKGYRDPFAEASKEVA